MSSKKINEENIIDMLQRFAALDEISGDSKDFTSRVDADIESMLLEENELSMVAGGIRRADTHKKK